MSHRRFAGVVALACAVLATSACASAKPTASVSPTSTLSAAPSVTLVPEESPAASASLPSDCSQIGTAATRAGTVDQLELQGDGADFVRPAPEGARLVLGCDWFAGDATGYLLLVSTADPAVASVAIEALPAAGWTCGANADDGDLCTLVTPHEQYPVDTVETIVSRAGVWIYQSATNVDGQALLADLQTSIWQS